jgi:hypothetical protein
MLLMIRRCWMLSVSLVVLGGLGLLLGSLVLLVVCSGINDRVEAHPQQRAGAGFRDAGTLSADYKQNPINVRHDEVQYFPVSQ